MGQAAVDLPDPAGGANATHVASADDLLSQLAGDEIDRLLAEADVEAEAQKSFDVPNATIELPQHEDENESPDLGSQIESALEQVAAPLEPAAGEIDNSSEDKAIDESLALGEASSAAELRHPIEPSSPVVVAAAPSSAASSDEQTSVQERSALAGGLSVAAPLNGSGQEESSSLAADETVPPLPIYLRPLEWLNAPLCAGPEVVREAMGKVALITLVNALAVLTYVLIFRR